MSFLRWIHLVTLAAASLVCRPVAASAADATPPAYAPRKASGSLGTIERRDPALDELLAPDAALELLAEGFDWSEGPVWSLRGEYLLFCDVPRNVVWKWREFEGLTEYVKPSGSGTAKGPADGSGANGLTLDNEGRLLLCQHGDRQVARMRTRGRFESLATNFQGKRLNSPNDLVLKSNGDIYFTDPSYGLPKGAEDPGRELPFHGVFRVSRRGQVTLLTKELTWPNGLAFSPDESILYVAVSDPARAQVVAFPVSEDGTLREARVVFDATSLVAGNPGLPDGLKVDAKGNLWTTGPGGVLILTPAGKHLGTLRTGEAIGNCAWGGDGSVLYLTADSKLCRIRTRTHGPIPGPLAETRRKLSPIP
ncbi:MAG: SMP-30/gluconolactonase/LRE family protein [Verrucomicrobiales bacterium]|nr:SMP-30/gluconolactonase/LRE family protein [Verrucomicrobiales bacterium]